VNATIEQGSCFPFLQGLGGISPAYLATSDEFSTLFKQKKNCKKRRRDPFLTKAFLPLLQTNQLLRTTCSWKARLWKQLEGTKPPHISAPRSRGCIGPKSSSPPFISDASFRGGDRPGEPSGQGGRRSSDAGGRPCAQQEGLDCDGPPEGIFSVYQKKGF